MASNDRFYQLSFGNREVLWGDVGSNIRIQGLVVGGSGCQAIFLLPGMAYNPSIWRELKEEEWSDFIQRSDDPEILIGPEKVFQRKLRWEISGAIQQKVWAADGFKCMYCGAKMGHSGLTIDHFIPLEMGGRNDESNYLTACRACNKKKGNMSAEDWCKSRAIDAGKMEEYLVNRKLP